MQLFLAGNKEAFGHGMVHPFELDRIGRPQLRQFGQVSGDDMRDPRIATRRLVVGHQDDQLPVWKQLHGPKADGGRDQLHRPLKGQPGAFQLITHPIGGRMDQEIILKEVLLRARRKTFPFPTRNKPDLMRVLVDLFGIDAPGKDLEIAFILQQPRKVDRVLIKGQLISLLQRQTGKSAGSRLEIRTVAVEPFLEAIATVYAEITPASLDQRRKMKDGILPNDDRLPPGDLFIIDRGGEISACYSDKRILLEKDLGAREMDLDDRLMLVIAYQEIGHLGRIHIHRSAGIHTDVSETMPAQVLYGVEQAGLDNGKSHRLILIWGCGSQQWLQETGFIGHCELTSEETKLHIRG